jgi:hypothetical protein
LRYQKEHDWNWDDHLIWVWMLFFWRNCYTISWQCEITKRKICGLKTNKVWDIINMSWVFYGKTNALKFLKNLKSFEAFKTMQNFLNLPNSLIVLHFLSYVMKDFTFSYAHFSQNSTENFMKKSFLPDWIASYKFTALKQWNNKV